MSISIEDKMALHELAARYGDIIDDRDWPALGSVFTDDAVFEVVALVTMRGLDDIKRYMENEGRHPLAHLITNIYVRQEGGGSAAAQPGRISYQFTGRWARTSGILRRVL